MSDVSDDDGRNGPHADQLTQRSLGLDILGLHGISLGPRGMEREVS